MNPAALKTNLGDLPARRHPDRQRGRVHRPEPEEGRLRGEPARGRLAQAVERLQRADLDAQRARARGPRPDQQAGRPLQELLRARADVLAVRARLDAHARAGSTRSSRSGRRSPRPTSARSRPATTSARRPRSSTSSYHVPPRRSSRPGTTARSPATRRPRSASSPPRKLAGRDLFYGSYPITPARDILHQLAGYKNFGVKTFQAEDEIAAIGAAIGACFGGAMGVTGTTRPGHRLKSEAHRPGGHDRAAAGHHRRAARRAAHRACRPRPSRPTCCRCMFGRNGESPGRDRRAGDARPTASTSRSRRGASRSST